MPRKFYIIESRWTGFFSNFCHTLQHLRRAEAKSRFADFIPLVYWHDGCYARHVGCKDNIWEYYFEQVSPYSIDNVDWERDEIKITSKYLKTNLPRDPQSCWDFKVHPPRPCLNSSTQACRDHVYGVIQRNVKIKQHVMKKVNDFVDTHFTDNFTIGVHWRETRDVRINSEWMGKDPFKKYCELISSFLKNHGNATIFLATDSYNGIERFKKEFSNVIHYDAVRSSTEYPIQYAFIPKQDALKSKSIIGPQAGEESLIDCLLLSRCNCMVYGISNLSACAAYFNNKMDLAFGGRLV